MYFFRIKHNMTIVSTPKEWTFSSNKGTQVSLDPPVPRMGEPTANGKTLHLGSLFCKQNKSPFCVFHLLLFLLLLLLLQQNEQKEKRGSKKRVCYGTP